MRPERLLGTATPSPGGSVDDAAHSPSTGPGARRCGNPSGGSGRVLLCRALGPSLAAGCHVTGHMLASVALAQGPPSPLATRRPGYNGHHGVSCWEQPAPTDHSALAALQGWAVVDRNSGQPVAGSADPAEGDAGPRWGDGHGATAGLLLREPPSWAPARGGSGRRRCRVCDYGAAGDPAPGLGQGPCFARGQCPGTGHASCWGRLVLHVRRHWEHCENWG